MRHRHRHRGGGGGVGGRGFVSWSSRYGGMDTNTDTLLHIPSDADSAAFVDGIDTHKQRLDRRVPPALFKAVLEEAHATEAKLADVKRRLAEEEISFDDAFLPLSPEQLETMRAAAAAAEEREDEEEEEEEDAAAGPVPYAELRDNEDESSSSLRNPEGGSVCVTLTGMLEPVDVRVDAVAAPAGAWQRACC